MKIINYYFYFQANFCNSVGILQPREISVCHNPLSPTSSCLMLLLIIHQLFPWLLLLLYSALIIHFSTIFGILSLSNLFKLSKKTVVFLLLPLHYFLNIHNFSYFQVPNLPLSWFRCCPLPKYISVVYLSSRFLHHVTISIVPILCALGLLTVFLLHKTAFSTPITFFL